MIAQALFMLTISIVICGGAFAQLPVPAVPRRIGPAEPVPGAQRVSLGKGPITTVTLKALDESMPALNPARLAPLVSGSWEAEIIGAGKQAARHVLRIELGNFTGYYTLPTVSGDTLVARWDAAASGGSERAIWLWDTPHYTMFVLEVNPALLQPKQLSRYSEDLLVWDKEPVWLRTLELHYGNATVNKEQIAGKATHEVSSAGNLYFELAGAAHEGRAYIAVMTTKAFLRRDYPVGAMFVPERFPPLRSRLASLSRYSLFEKLGKGYHARQIITYPGARDRIILDELLSRGPLSTEEVKRIAVGRFDQGTYDAGLAINKRLGNLLAGLEQRKELGRYAPALVTTLLQTPISTSAQDFVAAKVFASMKRQGINFTREALTFVEHGMATRQSLLYLETSAPEEAVLRKLSEIKVKPEFELRKRQAIEKIAKQLRLKQTRG